MELRLIEGCVCMLMINKLIDEYFNAVLMKQDRPVVMEAGKPIKIRVVYRQTHQSGYIQLKMVPDQVQLLSLHGNY